MDEQFDCEQCGGKDYYLESGFYYCKECNMQAREFREAVFESQETAGGATGARLTTKKADKEKGRKEKLSTFETYNYILLGLVNELIAAGAKKELKGVVKVLWFKYLKKLEVIREGPPKLGAVYSNVDVEIFYNRKRKKARKRTASGSSSSDETESSSRRSKTKRKKEFIKAGYEQEVASQESASIANQSLTSLKGSSDSSLHDTPKLLFRKTAKSELLRSQKLFHLNRHCKDFNSDLKCHKPTTRSLSTVYKNSPNMLTRNKLYCIIHLGLLLIKDKFQLGDVLRLIREGHLSYNSVMHFFPEELREKHVDVTKYLARKMPLTHFATLQASVEMAKYLKITREIPLQNLMVLCERYCIELNLPEEICECALKIMAKAVPKMFVAKTAMIMPNYEARAMSFIMFAMKLLFGLDDVTEHEFSKYATILNDESRLKKKMFVFDDWIRHIQYRKCVLSHYHFPTSFLHEQSLKNVDLYVDFLKKHHERLRDDDGDDDAGLPAEFDVYKKIFRDLNGENESLSLDFSVSLTPFRHYTEALLKSQFKNEFLHNLKDDYSKTSLDYLLRPYAYLKLINGGKNVEVKHRGANENMKFERIRNHKREQAKKLERKRKFVTVKLAKTIEETLQESEQEQKEQTAAEISTETVLKVHRATYQERHNKNIMKTRDLSDGIKLPLKRLSNTHEYTYSRHYNPHETYWLFHTYLERCGGEEGFEEVLRKLPHSFELLLEECARVLEMHKKHLLEEFINVELYLCYVARYRRKNFREPVFDEDLKKLIEKAKKCW